MGALYSSVITFTATEVGLFLRESNYYSRIETVTNYLLQLSVITPADCDSHLQELPSPHRVHKQQIQEGVLNTVHLYRQSAIFNDTIKWQKIYIYLYTLFLFVCLFVFYWLVLGGTVLWWLAHSKVWGSNLGSEFSRTPCACVGFLRTLISSHRHACQVIWSV